jgi:hypothetical protein
VTDQALNVLHYVFSNLVIELSKKKLKFDESLFNFVYYESIRREVKIRCIYECRCDERLQTKTKEFTLIAYTGLVVELEHLKIETRLIDEKFANAMGEYVT